MEQDTNSKLKSPYFIVAAAAAAVPLAASFTQARLFMTQGDALRKAFPEPDHIERKTAFLSDDQVAQIQHIARAKVDSRLITYYVGQNESGASGMALFDTAIVRTMPVTYMVLISPSGEIRSVEILAFYEPDDYLPRKEWLNLYRGKGPSSPLRLRQDIPNITGASLTSETMNNGVRKLLAAYQIIQESTPK